jgi:hypothetical protein
MAHRATISELSSIVKGFPTGNRSRIALSSVLSSVSREALRCRQKFLRFFPGGFGDETYLAWERGYKWTAHQQWEEFLNRERFRSLLKEGLHREIATTAVRIESRTNLLFSFEKMALRDAVKSKSGSKLFATSLFEFLHGRGSLQNRFEQWRDAVAKLPRKRTRVLTWPIVTVFGFIAQPETHMFLKPTVTRTAARAYGFDFDYQSLPAWRTYQSLLSFAHQVRQDMARLAPQDLIDIQSFIWVQGSSEYDE